MGLALRTFVAAACLAVIGLVSGQGSFSAKVMPLDATIEVNVEQRVREIEGWRVYAGSGFRASPNGIESFSPYTMACRELDLWVAYSEFCLEGRAPIVGDGDWMTGYLSIVW